LDLDGEIIPCFIREDDTKFDSVTNWPDSALAILGFTQEDVIRD